VTAEPPRTRAVDAHWLGGYRCDVVAGDHVIRVDEPADAGGDDTGPQPTELLLASLASCFALAIAHVAKKRGIELAGVDVRAVGTYAGPSFSDLTLEVSLDHERADELIERARAVCYVSNTFARNPAIVVKRR